MLTSCCQVNLLSPPSLTCFEVRQETAHSAQETVVIYIIKIAQTAP